ncbi:hypothetical protein JB92DRAFT_1413821 [Gautieria morchelliformis]|nr:hypothetical protein JB92DRAFT_1413821 [Gautieria morchelliformis]
MHRWGGSPNPTRRRPRVTLLLALLPTPSSSRPKCAQPSPTPANPAPTMLHERVPFLLTLMTLANALHTHGCVPHSRASPCAWWRRAVGWAKASG